VIVTSCRQFNENKSLDTMLKFEERPYARVTRRLCITTVEIPFTAVDGHGKVYDVTLPPTIHLPYKMAAKTVV